MFCLNPYQPNPLKHDGLSLLFPCRKCLICRIKIRNEWTTRMIFETLVSGTPLFVTLTYSNQNLPKDSQLSKRDLQLFVKRLRKRVSRKIRYFSCGEYGARTHRPHYHLIIWGLDLSFKDDIFFSWGLGLIDVKEAVPSAFRYVAGYVVKKYSKFEDENEFTLMSRRPGIGFGFLERLSKYRDETGTDVVKWFSYQGKRYRVSSYCVARMRKFAFDEDYIKDLSKVNLQDFSYSLRTTSWIYSDHVKDPVKREQYALDFLRKNVLTANYVSNVEFLKRSSIYKRKDKL